MAGREPRLLAALTVLHSFASQPPSTPTWTATTAWWTTSAPRERSTKAETWGLWPCAGGQARNRWATSRSLGMNREEAVCHRDATAGPMLMPVAGGAAQPASAACQKGSFCAVRLLCLMRRAKEAVSHHLSLAAAHVFAMWTRVAENMASMASTIGRRSQRSKAG